MASPSLRKPPSEQHFSELNGSCVKAVRNQTPLTEAGREGAFLTRPAAKAPDWAWATVSNASTQRAIGQRCAYSCELVCGNWGTEPCLHGVTSSLLDNPLFVSGARHPAKLALATASAESHALAPLSPARFLCQIQRGGGLTRGNGISFPGQTRVSQRGRANINDTL